MYFVKKRIEISYSHQLKLDYESKCQRVHGHNGIITIYCCAESLNSNGMVADFTHLKEQVVQRLDHQHLNDSFEFNTTAENLSRWICDSIPQAYKVVFQESEGNIAAYIRPGFEHVGC